MRILFISKNKNDTLNFAVIDEYGDVLAIGQARDGWCFRVHQISQATSSLFQVYEFIKKEETRGGLKCEK